MHFQILHFFILLKWINLLEMSLGLYSNQGKKTVHNCSSSPIVVSLEMCWSFQVLQNYVNKAQL